MHPSPRVGVFRKWKINRADRVIGDVIQQEISLRSVIWKSDEGRQRLEGWYDCFQAKIESNVEVHRLPTTFGETHILESGVSDGPPLVCLHAMRTGASFLLSELGPVLRHFRVIAPDLPGQSIRGIDARLSLKDDSHSQWLIEILDHFDLQTVPIFGVSWGGSIARIAMSNSPARFTKLALLVPAGIANGSHLTGLFKMAIPMVRYRLNSSGTNLRTLLKPLISNWDEDWANSFACSLRDMKLDTRIPPLATDQELQAIECPTLVLAADRDISFPGKAVIDRVSRLVPDVDAELIENCKHCPPTTEEFREWLGQRLVQFVCKGAGVE